MAKCNICGTVLEFELDEVLSKDEILGYRETLDCSKCNSISRDRGLIWALSNCIQKEIPLFELKNNKKLKILESTGLRAYPKILKEKFDYCNPRFSKFVPLLKMFPNKYADLQRLFFQNNEFDFVLASDIFEHIRLDENAFSEIFRVLKPKGYFIMTIPFDYTLEQTIEKIKVVGDKDIFLSEPEYHNKGVKDGGDSLYYRLYGKSLFKKLTNIGFNVGYLRIQIPKYGISQIELFFCRKNTLPDLKDLSSTNLILKKEIFRNN